MTEAELKAELTRMISALAKIRDVVECPAPRHPSLEWYKSVLEHVRRYVAEVLPGEDNCG
jgi:hypothetical protein